MCPDINEGLTVEGQPVQDAPAADPGLAVPEESALRDPSKDSAYDIAKGVLSPATSPTVADGLTVANLPDEPIERVELSAEDKALVRQAGIDLAREQEELELGREAVVELAIRDFEQWFAEERDGDSGSIVHRLAELRSEIPEEDYGAVQYEVASQLSGDTEAAAQADYLLEEMTSKVVAEQQILVTEEKMANLLPALAEQRVKQYESIVKGWASDAGLRSDREVQQRFRAAEMFAKSELGIDLEKLVLQPTFDEKLFNATLRAADATLAEEAASNATRAFQKSVLEQPSTSISEGLEHRTPWGWESDAPTLPPEVAVDGERVVARSQRRRSTPASIKAAVASPSNTSIESGLTGPDGKSISVDRASGADRRHRQQQEDARARSRGLLR